MSFENYKIYLLLESLNFRLKKLRGRLGINVNFNYFSRLRVQSDLIKSFEIIKVSLFQSFYQVSVLIRKGLKSLREALIRHFYPESDRYNVPLKLIFKFNPIATEDSVLDLKRA